MFYIKKEGNDRDDQIDLCVMLLKSRSKYLIHNTLATLNMKSAPLLISI